MSTASPSASTSLAANLTPEVRSSISLALFVHWFMVCVAVSSYVAPSDLQARLQRLFAPYLQTLNFNLSHTYGSAPRLFLTHAALNDVDFIVEVGAQLADADSPRRSLPPHGLSLPIRRRRFQNLANAMGSLVQNENADSILPRAVGGVLLRQLQLEQGEMRILRHLLVGMDEAGSSDADARNPYAPNYYQTAYEAQLLTTSGVVELMKRSEARDVAPVERRAAPRSVAPDAAGAASSARPNLRLPADGVLPTPPIRGAEGSPSLLDPPGAQTPPGVNQPRSSAPPD